EHPTAGTRGALRGNPFGYGATGGFTGPPITSAVVCTLTRPAPTSVCRKSSSGVHFAGCTVYAPQWASQKWWNTNWIHRVWPLEATPASAFVTYRSIVASFVALSGFGGVRVAKGSTGGRVA